MTKQTFTTAYSRKADFIRECNSMKYTHPSKVKQSLAYATDINKIYEDYCRSGRLPLNGQTPIYDENFVKYDSLIEAQKVVKEACEYFNGLPSRIKNQYGNSLEKFVLALNNKDDFLINEGLLQIAQPIKEDIPVQPQPETTVSEPVNTATTD